MSDKKENDGWSQMMDAPKYRYVLLRSTPKLIFQGSGTYSREYAVAQFEDWDEPGWYDQSGQELDFLPDGYVTIPGELSHEDGPHGP